MPAKKHDSRDGIYINIAGTQVIEDTGEALKWVIWRSKRFKSNVEKKKT